MWLVERRRRVADFDWHFGDVTSDEILLKVIEMLRWYKLRRCLELWCLEVGGNSKAVRQSFNGRRLKANSAPSPQKGSSLRVIQQ